LDADLARKIGNFWSKNRAAPKTRWWDSPVIIRHINAIVNGEPIDGFSMGLINRAKSLLGNRLPLEKGISIGCGNGAKEMQLIGQGLVESFDLFELSDDRIAKGRLLAKDQGIEDNINFVKGDAFSLITLNEKYDLVHWNNSLHHMMDVHYAVSWSRKVLKTGGLFYMDDFVGPSRFQWPDRQLAIASEIRRSLRGTKYLRNPVRNSLFSRKFLPCRLTRPDLEAMRLSDPSEAADSEQILPGIAKQFPEAEIIKTGGIVYSLALKDVIANFDESLEKDRRILQSLLDLEIPCINKGETHYAVCLAIKN
jgi:SAM-dependent methyltransferase